MMPTPVRCEPGSMPRMRVMAGAVSGERQACKGPRFPPYLTHDSLEKEHCLTDSIRRLRLLWRVFLQY